MLYKETRYYKETKYSDGSFIREWRNVSRQLHRELAPAVIWYYPDGSISSKAFYFKDSYHRELGPAYTWYNQNGSIKLERFYVNGVYLGNDKEGFLMLWRILSDEKRKSPEILKCLTRYL